MAAARIDPRNAQRVKRALEVHAVSGEPSRRSGRDKRTVLRASAVMRRSGLRCCPMIACACTRSSGSAQRDARGRARGRGACASGARRFVPDLPSIRAVGYRQVWAHLEGEYGAEEMREKALAATRQLARRQLTWLRRWPKGVDIELKAGGRPPAALAAGLGVRLRELGARALS